MGPPEPIGASARDAASFRDPSGYVFERGGAIFRAVDGTCLALLRELDDRGLLRRLQDEGLLVRTGFVEGPLLEGLAAEHGREWHFLEHERIWPITYPYEWSVSMLADAAVATIDMQLRLLEEGCSLKDATAYNVQFVAGRPVFIDVSSIERPTRLDLWFALGQFQQMFTFPLLLAGRGWDLRSYFLASIGGRTAEQVAGALGPVERWRPKFLVDVVLPALLAARADRRGPRRQRELLDRPRPDATAQRVNLRRLRRKVGRLAASYRPRGTWSEYTRTCSYGAAAEAAKKAMVGEFLERTRPRTVIDLGCNTGDYSFLAAERGARVVAADADPDAVELLYRRLRGEPAEISPAVLDLGNPSPAVGFRNRERPSFLDRVAEGDCVLALALVHHLHVAGNLPLPAIRDLLAGMARRDLVLEFVPREDPMFERLMRFRVDLYGAYGLEGCRRVFAERFEVVAERPIPGSPRTLLFLRRRGSG